MKIKKYQNAGVLPRLKNFGRRVFNTMNSVSQQASENMRDVHTGTLHSDIKNLQDKDQYEKAQNLAKGYLKANAAGITAGVGTGVAGFSNVLNPSTYLAKLPAAIAGTENATAIASAAAPVIDASVAGGYAAGSATKAVKNLKEKNYKQFAINAGLTALSAIPAVKGFRSAVNNTNHSAELMQHLYNSARYNPKWFAKNTNPIRQNIINYNTNLNKKRVFDFHTSDSDFQELMTKEELLNSINSDRYFNNMFNGIKKIPIGRKKFIDGLKEPNTLATYYGGGNERITFNFTKKWNPEEIKNVTAHELQHSAQNKFLYRDVLTERGQNYWKPNSSNKKIYELFDKNTTLDPNGSWITSPNEWNSEYAYLMQKTGNWVPYNQLSTSQKKPILTYFGNRFHVSPENAHTILDTMARLGYKHGGKLNDSI